MRIQSIEITNYKAFLATNKISVEDKNLFIYGENGSGKSSRCDALKNFFQLPIEDIDIAGLENIFSSTGKGGAHGVEDHNTAQVEAHDEALNLADTEKKILAACGEASKSTQEFWEILGYRTRTGNFKKAMSRLCEQWKVLEPTLPDIACSKNQKYRLTAAGRKLLSSVEGNKHD